MIRNLLRYLTPVAGRLTPTGAIRLGYGLTDGCGFIGIGPVLVLISLPAFLRVQDSAPAVPTVRVLSLSEINANLRSAPQT